MQRAMVGLERVIRRRPWVFVGVWAVLLVAALPFAIRQSDHLTGGGFNVPGSQAENVRLQMDRGFTGGERAGLGVVLVPAGPGRATAAPPGPAAPLPRPATAPRPAAAAQLTAALARAEAVVHSQQIAIPPAADAGARAAARRGGTVILSVPLTVSLDRSIDVATHLRAALGVGLTRAGVTTHLIGQGALWAGMQEISKQDLKRAESTGFPIVLLILLAVFGSLAAAALPLVLGVASVMITGALIFFLSQALAMSVFVTNMASMIGIGVAVDYSLFVLARYREEIAAGRAPDEARATALATSGIAVIFSGLTVIVSLAGLWMVDNAAIHSMALGAMLVVAVSVLASATLLPALIALLGKRAAGYGRVFSIVLLAARRRRTRGARSDIEPAKHGFWLRWTRAVTRRPALTAAGAVAVLLILAIPTLSLSIGTGALQQFPPGNETRAGFEAAARVTGPGAASPIYTLVRFHGQRPHHAAIANAVRTRIASDPAVAAVQPATFSRDRSEALVAATPRADGESGQAKALVARLRIELPAVAGPGAQVEIGGVTAQQRDFAGLVSGSMWRILLFVLALSYTVLLVLLRSVVLPLKAVVMNLLSVGAAYGALVAVFQWGWFSALLGVHSQGHLDALTPPLVLAVVFGLSMDYEVFLLTRIRERWRATGDPRLAVAEGLASSARTITSAALIMASVFAVFLGTSIPSIQEIGLGNAVAVAIDATLVRLVLVPATMELLGKWNWWLPRPLARVLPRAAFEHAPAGRTAEPAPA
jgi:RND superfamily putative drug exporter